MIVAYIIIKAKYMVTVSSVKTTNSGTKLFALMTKNYFSLDDKMGCGDLLHF